MALLQRGVRASAIPRASTLGYRTFEVWVRAPEWGATAHEYNYTQVTQRDRGGAPPSPLKCQMRMTIYIYRKESRMIRVTYRCF